MKAHWFRTAALCAVALAFLVSGGTAAAADPCLPTELSIVPRCVLVSPTGALVYRVTIIGCNGPIQNSNVEIRFTIPGDTLLCWCTATTDPGPPPLTHSFFASTNVSGVATFNIRAGGCIEWNLAAIPGPQDYAGEIFADGVKMQEFGTASPDAVDGSGRLPTNPSPLWNPNGVCATGLADAVEHTAPIANALYSWCSDLNCDNATGIADAVILTPYLAGAASCPGDAGASP